MAGTMTQSCPGDKPGRDFTAVPRLPHNRASATAPDTSGPGSAGPSGMFARFARDRLGVAGAVLLLGMLALCLGSLTWTLGPEDPAAVCAARDARPAPRFNAGAPIAGRLPPAWWPASDAQARRINQLVPVAEVAALAAAHGVAADAALATTSGPLSRELRAASPVGRFPLRHALGTDPLGRSMLYRCLTGGGVSLLIGLAAAGLSVLVGTVYGAISGYAGGRVDAAMMRIVDVLYGLPYILLVVLIAVAGDAAVEQYTARTRERAAWVKEEAARAPATDHAGGAELERRTAERFPARRLSDGARTTIDLLTLLLAIGGVSWLTMARVIRAQVQSLKARPFIEAARAIGVGRWRLFARHLVPNLAGTIVVYASLTVPQAILQESFLSFLGIGVKPPLPSWGTLAADGLGELNPYESNWWLLLFPCLLLAVTLLSLNFVGEALRRALDPRAAP